MSIHENSTISRDLEKASGRSGEYRRQIYIAAVNAGCPKHDRYYMELLQTTDNLIRPEITRLLDDGILRELPTKVKCPTTGRLVRVTEPTGKVYDSRASGPRPKKADTIPIDPALLECLLQLVDAVQSRDLVAAEELADQAYALINPAEPPTDPQP